MDVIEFVSVCCLILLNVKTVSSQLVATYHVRYVKDVTEVRSRDGEMADEAVILSEEKYVELCKGGLERLEKRITRKSIRFVWHNEIDVLKEYVIEVGKNKWEVSFNLLPLFKCSTTPPFYIYIDEMSPAADKYVVWVIFKHSDPRPNLQDIMGYQVAFVDDITEAFSDEMAPKISEEIIENSLLDTDEISDDERLLICRKVMKTAPEMNISLLKNSSNRMSRYYVVRRSDECELSPEGSIQGFVQAFECPTQPPIYVHVNDRNFAGLTLWFITQKSADHPPLEFVGYQVKTSLDIIRILAETVKQINPDRTEKSSIDFDQFTEKERREMCLRTLETVFGRRLEILNDFKTKRSKFYALHETEEAEVDDDDIVQAVRCPTEPAAYIHVTERECDGNILWILIRRNDFKNLSIWG